VLVGFKHERELHLLASRPDGSLAFVRAYPILGASGTLGPKLRQGDRQVPEGIYAIVDVKAEPATVSELDRQLNLNESVLRTKVMRTDKH